MTPTSSYLSCPGREIHCMEWGSGNTETVIAWHGLARTGRDMDDLAAHLATRQGCTASADRRTYSFDEEFR